MRGPDLAASVTLFQLTQDYSVCGPLSPGALPSPIVLGCWQSSPLPERNGPSLLRGPCDHQQKQVVTGPPPPCCWGGDPGSSHPDCRRTGTQAHGCGVGNEGQRALRKPAGCTGLTSCPGAAPSAPPHGCGLVPRDITCGRPEEPRQVLTLLEHTPKPSCRPGEAWLAWERPWREEPRLGLG